MIFLFICLSAFKKYDVILDTEEKEINDDRLNVLV